MGGCVGEMYALKAFKAYKDLANGELAPAREEPTAVPNNAWRHHGFCTSSAARRERRIRHVKSNGVPVLPRFSRLPRAARRG